MHATMIGLDIAKSVFQMHGADASRHAVLRKRCNRRQLLDFLGGHPACEIALEACGTSHHMARELSKLGHKVRLIPPEVVKGFVRPSMKTDARDAQAICLAMQQPDIHSVPIKSEEQQAQCFVQRARSLLIHQRTQTSNHLRSLCAEMGMICAKGFKPLYELLAQIISKQRPVPEMFRALAAEQFEHLQNIDARIRKLDKQIEKAVRTDKVSRRFLAVPGIGPITTHALQAGVVEPERFTSGRRFAAWLGLAPGIRASGNKTIIGCITKHGDEIMRSLLVTGAMSVVAYARSHPDKADPWIVGLLARRPVKVVAVALAAKMARIVWAMFKSGQDYRPRAAARPQAQSPAPRKPVASSNLDPAMAA